jgi:Amt family ammonium transporter
VHSVGGWAALTGAIILGPRFGKFGPRGQINAIPGHNMSLALIGALVLWLGWFGFNPGSTMAADPRMMSHICLTTNMAACTGILAATFMSWFMLKKPDLGMTINGCLAGLVAITAPCAFVSVSSAAVIGAIAGAIVVPAVILFDKVKVDDPVGATSVHLVCGILGTLFVGIFAEDWVSPNTTGNGLLFGGGIKLLMAQLTGVVAVGAFVLIASSAAWYAIKAIFGLRVSLHEEIEGLDIGEHGNQAYPDFVARKSHYTHMGASATDAADGSSSFSSKTSKKVTVLS